MPLVRRGNSSYWYAQFRLNGHTIVRSTRTTDRKAAERFEVALRAEAYSELVLGKKRQLTLGDALDRYVATKSGTPNHPNLCRQSRAVLATFSGRKFLSEFANQDLEQHRSRRAHDGRSPQTIKHELQLILRAFRHAKSDGFDAPDLRSPKLRLPSTKLRYLSAIEEQQLLSALVAPKENEPRRRRYDASRQDALDLVVLLLDTGARYGEIAGLTWSQVDLPTRIIRLWRPKVQNESIIHMTTRVTERLANRQAGAKSKFVFSNSVGGARGYRVSVIRKAFDRAGLHDCSLHTLRHTHASRLIQNGMTIYEVRAVLGHSDIKTTMRYAHLEEASVTSKARDVIERLSTDPNF